MSLAAHDITSTFTTTGAAIYDSCLHETQWYLIDERRQQQAAKNLQNSEADNNEEKQDMDIYASRRHRNWKEALLYNQSRVALVNARVSRLNNVNIQTFTCLSQTRVKYLNFHTFLREPDYCTIPGFTKIIMYFVKHNYYSVFFKGILAQCWNDYTSSAECKSKSERDVSVPATDAHWKKSIEWWLTSNVNDNRNYFFYSADFDLLNLLFFNPLEELQNEADCTERTGKSLINVSKHFEESGNSFLVLLQKQWLYSNGHFALIAKALVPAKWQFLVEGKYTDVLKEVIAIGVAISDPKTLQTYTAKYNASDDKDTMLSPKTVSALLVQLVKRCSLISKFDESTEDCDNSKNKSKSKKSNKKVEQSKSSSYLPILFGFYSPAWILNHYQNIDPNKVGYLAPAICLGDGADAKYFSNVNIITRMFIQAVKCIDEHQYAKKQISGKSQRFVFPGRIKTLIDEMMNGENHFFQLFRFVCHFPDITFLIYTKIRVNTGWNGLASGYKAICKTRGNWTVPYYWHKCSLAQMPKAAPDCQPLRSPMTNAIAVYHGKLAGLPMHTKLAGVGPNHLIGVTIDSYMFGYEILFGKKGLKYGETEAKWWNDFFYKHGLQLIETDSPEAMFAGLYKNFIKLKNKTICLVEVSHCINPSAKAVKWASKYLGSFNQSMFMLPVFEY